MEVYATQKYVLTSPKKIRLVASRVKKLSPKEALAILPFVGKKGAEPLMKVLKSALANASQKGLKEEELVIKEIQIGEGPRLKRGRPVSRGMWHPYRKRMSHIRVVLETKPKSEKTKPKTKKGTKNGTKS